MPALLWHSAQNRTLPASAPPVMPTSEPLGRSMRYRQFPPAEAKPGFIFSIMNSGPVITAPLRVTAKLSLMMIEPAGSGFRFSNLP